MKILLAALAGIGLLTSPVEAKVEHHHRHHHKQNKKIRVYIGTYPSYYNRYQWDYRRYGFYSGPIWREGTIYRCLAPNGRYGILKDRYGRIVWKHRIRYAPRPFQCD